MKRILTKTTYLEMFAPPAADGRPAPPDVAIERLDAPTPECYRWLYNSVGRDYQWVDRNRLSDAELSAILLDPSVDVFLLRVAGQPAGYAELDRRRPGEIELAYFGLFPGYTGRGLGAFFLNWTVARAWSHQPRRVWVHTCDLDHPAALPVYLKAGFVVYDEKMIEQVIPES